MNSQILDVVISLSFIYLLLSFMATGILESLSGLLNRRGRSLEMSIKNLLACGTYKDLKFGEKLANEILDHALITSLGKSYKIIYWVRRKPPSYIPSNIFAVALTDTLIKCANMPANSIITSDMIENIESSSLRQVLNCLMSDSNGDMNKFRLKIERWYDDSMDRTSGTYKRYSQIWLFAIGLIVAVGLNIDSIWVSKRLWQDPVLRETIITQASAYATLEPITNQDKAVADAKAAFNSLPLPIGWPISTEQKGGYEIFGWILTAFAISFGAQFWFDSLRYLFSIRMSGPKPKRNIENMTDDEISINPTSEDSFEKQLSDIDIKDLQTVLGLSSKDQTGILDTNTRNLIIKFQKENGIPVTNVLSSNLYQQIMSI